MKAYHCPPGSPLTKGQTINTEGKKQQVKGNNHRNLGHGGPWVCFPSTREKTPKVRSTALKADLVLSCSSNTNGTL